MNHPITKRVVSSVAAMAIAMSTMLPNLCVTANAVSCNHNCRRYSAVKTQATCTKDGVKQVRCANCNAVISSTAIKATGHNYNVISTKKATCTTDGSQTSKCSKCSAIKTVKLNKLGHYTTGSWTTVRNATCTAKGKQVLKCGRSGCSAVLSTREIAAIGHNYKVISTQKATCTANGKEVSKCTRCSAQKTVTLYKTGHSTNGSWTTIRKATCTSEGLQALKCTRSGCSAQLSTRTIPKTSHSYAINDNGVSVSIKCKSCTSTIRPGSINWDKFISYYGKSWSKCTNDEKETLAKQFLRLKGCNSDAVNIAFTYNSNGGKKLNINNVDTFKSYLSDLDKASKISGFSYASQLSDALTYAGLGADVYVFASNMNSQAYAGDALVSFVNLSSTLTGFIPVIGPSYSKILSDLKGPLKDLYNAIDAYNKNLMYTGMEAFYENWTLGEICENYSSLCSEEGKKNVDYYIQYRIGKEFKNATGVSIEDFYKNLK